MNSVTKWSLISLAILGLAIAAFGLYVVGTPEYALFRIQTAIREHDSETLHKYIDTESISNSMIADMSDSASFKENGFSLLFAERLQMIARQTVDKLVGTLADHGQLGTHAVRELKLAGIKREGKLAIAFLRPPQDKPFSYCLETLRCEMRKTTQGYWRVTNLPGFFDAAKCEADEAGAIGTLRVYNTACVTYASRYNRFPTSLLAMGEPRGLDYHYSESAAGLLSSSAATGAQYGYTFSFHAQNNGYWITATPDVYRHTGKRNFYTDQTGIVRFTTEQRNATNQDDELAAK